MKRPRLDAEHAAFAAILLVCCATRLWQLDVRGVMHDESLFVYYTWFHLVREFDYDYQPILHGPAMLWLQAMVFRVFGDTTFAMRLGCALLGIGGLFWIRAMRPWLGCAGTLVASALYTISPTLMFYQRFFRNDALFVFATLWTVVSLARWWRSRHPGWMASFVLGAAVLFCNKESCLFVYFTLATFGLLTILHDIVRWTVEDAPRATAEPTGQPPPPPVRTTALLLFGAVALMLTRVFEGISYEQSVVDAIGRDFALRDVRSIPLALGWSAPVGGIGALGQPAFWCAFYGVLAFASIAAAWTAHLLVVRRIGYRHLAAELWRAVHGARWWIAGAGGLGFAAYMVLFTTGFAYPAGPLAIYRDTLEYWMGQNAQHRISGPFHMHLLNMLVYETGPLLFALCAMLSAIVRMKWTRTLACGLFPAAIALAAFHVLFFRSLDRQMPYFAVVAAWTIIAGAAIAARPSAGRPVAIASFAAFLAWSLFHFHRPEWTAFLAGEVVRDGETLARSGHAWLDDRLSLTSGSHLFLIALPILGGTVLTWRAIHRGERFHALLVWWLVTIVGAVSYAREKVPWVGIYITVPLVLLAGSYAQRAWDRARSGTLPARYSAAVAAALLAAGALVGARSSYKLCFVNYDTVRERMIYAHPPREVKVHTRIVLDAAARAAAGDGPPLRIHVGSPELQWPMRWYLRDLDWDMGILPSTGSAPEYDFLFLEDGARLKYPWLEENYALFDGRAHMHWVPQRLDTAAAFAPWQDPAAFAKVWRQWLRYYWFREIPKTGGVNGLSHVPYVFAIPLDAAGSVGEPVPDIDDPTV